MKKLLTISGALVVTFWGLALHAAGDFEAGQTKANECVGCHGLGGNPANVMLLGAENPVPKIAGQPLGYMAKQLGSFKSGARIQPLMHGVAVALSDEDMVNLDLYYSKQPVEAGMIPEEKSALAREGEQLFRAGSKERSIPACMSCHGPDGRGISTAFPRVAGQFPEYLKKQLESFKAEQRKDEVMTSIAFRLNKRQIEAVTTYMYGMK